MKILLLLALFVAAQYRWVVLIAPGGKEVAYKTAPDSGWVFVNDAGPVDALNVCVDVTMQLNDLAMEARKYMDNGKGGGP